MASGNRRTSQHSIPRIAHIVGGHKTTGEKLFDIGNCTFIVLLCVATIYPFLYLLALSLSSVNVPVTKAYIIPPEWSLANYIKVLGSPYIGYGFLNSIFRTVIGTMITLVMVFITAYPLSKRDLPNRSFWTGIIVFTMFFGGGLIPSYLLVVKLGLINSLWSMIFPIAIPTFALIIVRNFLMTIPQSLEDSARIDGAGVLTILIRIVVPLSLPIVAVASLWTAVMHWNSWFDCLLYIRDANKQVLQVLLRRVVIEGTSDILDKENLTVSLSLNTEMVKAATTMVVTIPIVIVYPFIQKYFVKGILIGSLKG